MILTLLVLGYLLSMAICLIPEYLTWRNDKYSKNEHTLSEFIEGVDFSSPLNVMACVPFVNTFMATLLIFIGLWLLVFKVLLGKVKIK